MPNNALFGPQGYQPAPQPTDVISTLQGDPSRLQAAMARFSQDPAGILRSLGYNIPNQMMSPDQIGPYLLQSGQISQETINQVVAVNPNFLRLFSK